MAIHTPTLCGVVVSLIQLSPPTRTPLVDNSPALSPLWKPLSSEQCNSIGVLGLTRPASPIPTAPHSPGPSFPSASPSPMRTHCALQPALPCAYTEALLPPEPGPCFQQKLHLHLLLARANSSAHPNPVSHPGRPPPQPQTCLMRLPEEPGVRSVQLGHRGRRSPGAGSVAGGEGPPGAPAPGPWRRQQGPPEAESGQAGGPSPPPAASHGSHYGRFSPHRPTGHP